MEIISKRVGFTDESALEIPKKHERATLPRPKVRDPARFSSSKPCCRGKRAASSGFLAGGFGMLDGKGLYYRNG